MHATEEGWNWYILAEMRAIRDAPIGPPLLAHLMVWLRGKHHGCGNTPCSRHCNQQGRWHIGKWILRNTSGKVTRYW